MHIERPVKAGQELTFNYARQAHSKGPIAFQEKMAPWGFTCTCSLCRYFRYSCRHRAATPPPTLPPPPPPPPRTFILHRLCSDPALRSALERLQSNSASVAAGEVKDLDMALSLMQGTLYLIHSYLTPLTSHMH